MQSMPADTLVAPKQVFQIVYVSSAVEPMEPAELTALLKRARARNTADNVTGMLLYHDGNFMQLLEGEEKTVRATHQRIKRDPRHTGMITLIQAPAAERLCTDWSMGMKYLSAEDLRATPGLSSFLTGTPRGDSKSEASKVMRLLYQFRETLR